MQKKAHARARTHSHTTHRRTHAVPSCSLLLHIRTILSASWSETSEVQLTDENQLQQVESEQVHGGGGRHETKRLLSGRGMLLLLLLLLMLLLPMVVMVVMMRCGEKNE